MSLNEEGTIISDKEKQKQNLLVVDRHGYKVASSFENTNFLNNLDDAKRIKNNSNFSN